MSRKVVDIESSDLLQNGLSYLELPFKLKMTYNIWCIVIRDIDTDEVISLRPSECSRKNIEKALADCTEIIGHNIVAFDFPVLQLLGLLDYKIGYPGQDSTLFGRPVLITDTLLWSKLLNADRFGGHSLDAWGKRLGELKTEYNDWTKFTEEMLTYCIQDTNVNKKVFFALQEEKSKWNWDTAYSVELKLADLTLRQELFGFDFNKDLALQNIEDLDKLMQEIAIEVNPILPPKRLNKGQLADYILPVRRFKKNGEPSSYLLKFMEKHNCTLDIEDPNNRFFVYNGLKFDVLTDSPIKIQEPAAVSDIDTVKAYLLTLGWQPSEIKERDLVKNTDKTIKKYDEIIEAIDRYVDQTLNSEFKDLRCEALEVQFSQLRRFLVDKIDGTKPIWVPTTPKLTVGVEKEICPNLVSLGKKAEFVGNVVKYYTYRHRRNSIAGGQIDEDGDPVTGFLANVREDGRIPTPADTLGANTGRYRHKIVCNIPRVTSLYGEQMRNMFGSGPALHQLGYDFASLEARIMGHYVMPYTDGKALADSLVAEKPNDIHSINGKKLGIDRSSAKSFSYAAIYGAQPKKLAKMLGVSLSEAKRLFNDYWDAVPALKQLKERVEKFWTENGKTFITGLDGRKLATRSKHSLINVLFQSGGAIAAKWSAVRMAQYLEENNLLGDPFLHNISEHKVWWMIHMHDEQQLAVHPKLLKIKAFDSEEEAKTNMEQGCSAIGHGKKFYFGVKTAPVSAIEIGIKTACQELKLRVDLGFEWIPGKSWGQCH
jgi:hypothetical protein